MVVVAFVVVVVLVMLVIIMVVVLLVLTFILGECKHERDSFHRGCPNMTFEQEDAISVMVTALMVE